jgi:predicted dehydrogenase
MALDLTAEQRDLGRENFNRVADGLSRRGFMKSLAAAGAAVPVTAAVWFGYQSLRGKPVKAALIGAGDEGGVLVGEHNKDFLEFVAVCDLRPYNLDLKENKPPAGRIFTGDARGGVRKGFTKIYGKDAEKIRAYRDYKELLAKEKDVEAVVIATPLVTHAPIAIDCMKAGKHVLCEKLMARTIKDCKEMIRVARETNRILSIGHQRHYSMLYAHATEVLTAGVLGDVKHIRALWHRNNSWPYEAPKDGPALAQGYPPPKYRDGWYPPIYQADDDELRDKAKQYGYKDLEELVRWRLYDRTGGGLMAELGSHQMDACSIFLGKVKPLSVTGVGGKFFYGPGANDRECEDGIFVTFEFPGAKHPRGKSKGADENDVVVVTYSSVNTNGFENYGECVMGSRGTMVVEKEEAVLLYSENMPGGKGGPRSTTVQVADAGGGKPALDTGGGSPSSGAVPARSATGGAAAVSKGYREEMEDFAYCVRQWDAKAGYEAAADGAFKQRVPRCHGEVAMADAIIALTANLAMKKRKRVEFNPKWFDYKDDATPEAEV